MTLKECYAAMAGDYEDVLARFRTEERVQKFVVKFLEDPTYSNLEQALKEENYEEAFRAAHTLKGVCQNLSLTLLYQSSYELTEALRNEREQETIAKWMQQVTMDYKTTRDAIAQLG